jgi:hypothetical protein
VLKKTNSETKSNLFSKNKTGNFIGGKAIFLSSGRDARFDGEGNFMGLLQPK